MILGYEEPVQMPTMDIYSTDLMKMYIAAVKDQYDTAKEEYKDFLKSYQDFYSAAPGANQEYYNLTLGGAQNLMKQLAERGVDPFKSVEGRAAISNFINSVPVGRINALRQEAQIADEYLKSRDKLRAEGKFDPLTDAIVGGGNFDTWDRSKQGPWNRRYAIEDKSLGDLTSDFYSKLQKDEYIGPDKSRGADSKYYDLYGVSQDTLKTADAAALQALKDTPYYNLFAMKASGLTDAEGNPIDPDVALMNMIRQTNEKYWSQPESKKNEMAIERWKEARADARTARTIAASDRRAANRGNGKTNSNGYSYIANSQNSGLSNILINGNSDNIMDAQRNIIKNSKSSKDAISKFTHVDDATGYNKWLGAKDGVIKLTRNIINNLVTENEIVNDIRMADHSNDTYNEKGQLIRKPIQSVFGNKTSKVNKNLLIQALNSDAHPTISARNEIVTWVDENGIIKQAKPVEISYIGEDEKPHSVVYYHRLKEADRTAMNGMPLSSESFSSIDSQFSSTVGSMNTKRVNYDDYDYSDEDEIEE